MIPFVDAHVHFWALQRIGYPWLTAPFDESGPNGSVATIAHNYGPAQYMADLAGWNLAGAVHIEAGADPAAALDETTWLEEQADATSLPSAIVAFARLDDPNVDALLAAHARYARVRGIRHIVNWHPDPKRTYSAHDVTLDPAWERGFARLATYRLSFDLQCYPGQMAALAPLLARHLHTPVAINHLGMPVLTDADGLIRWRAGMTALAALPQVVVKVSGFGFIDRNWTLDQVQPLVCETIDRFGPERVLFATDFPTDTLFAPAARCLAALSACAAGYSEDEQRTMLGRNAARFYALDLAGLA